MLCGAVIVALAILALAFFVDIMRSGDTGGRFAALGDAAAAFVIAFAA